MSAFAATFILIICVSLLAVPRAWAPLPLLIGACYVPFAVELPLGPFHFTAVRVLVAVGVIRIVARREWLLGRLSALDHCVLLWGAWLLFTAPFHAAHTSPFIFRLGLVYDAFGIYFLVRAFCRTPEDCLRIVHQAAILLAPIALEMLYESFTGHNLFSLLGGTDEFSMVREGRVRAGASFGHPILAGTVGAIILPMMAGIWSKSRRMAMLGIVSCLTIVITSASSGPVLSAMAGLTGLYMWRHRQNMRLARWAVLIGYIALDLIMKDPAYFIIARVDLAGGSTSWYRARLIQSAFEHLSEWWIIGTDYTRNWMWVVVSWSPDHTDITSYYITMGVWAGLPLIGIFVLVLVQAFGAVGRSFVRLESPGAQDASMAFSVWTLGCALFVITVTSFSVSFFDQSVTLVWLVLATIASATWVPEIAASKSRRRGSRGKATAEPALPAVESANAGFRRRRVRQKSRARLEWPQ